MKKIISRKLGKFLIYREGICGLCILENEYGIECSHKETRCSEIHYSLGIDYDKYELTYYVPVRSIDFSLFVSRYFIHNR